MYSISFQNLFVQAFKIVVDSWKFTMLFLYILWDDWQIFMLSGSNEQLQQQLEYILLKLDCHSWWISKMQWGHFRRTICYKILSLWDKRLSLWDNWGDERGCDEGHWYAHTRGLRWGLPEVVGTAQVHCSRRRLLRKGLEFHVCTINKSAHTENVWKL